MREPAIGRSAQSRRRLSFSGAYRAVALLHGALPGFALVERNRSQAAQRAVGAQEKALSREIWAARQCHF